MAGEGKRLAVAIISIIAIVACAILIAQWAKKTSTGPKAYQVKTICQNCNKVSVHTIKGVADFPLLCPYCNQRACWKVYKCHACGYEFPKKPGQIVTSCPQCGSPEVGVAPVSE